MNSMSLNDIGLKYGTDKSSSHHDYLTFYELFLKKWRNSKLTILEVGVANGQSLKTWEEYFPKAKIIGVDITPETRRFEGGRISIEIADQSNVEQMGALGLKYGPFDLIVEDGSHMCDHQITTLRTLFPFVREDGVYIVEDLQTNYGEMLAAYRGGSSITCVDYLKKWLDLRVAGNQIDISKVDDSFLRAYGRAIEFMTFYRRACLIKRDFRQKYITFDTPLIDDDTHARSKRLTIVGHLSYAGDVLCVNGCTNGCAAGQEKEIQGFLINSHLGVLQYRAMSLDGVWTDWLDEGQFAGSRGKTQYLGGLAVRVKGSKEGALEVRTVARFVGNETPVVAVDGAACRSVEGRPICAFQVDLTSKSALAALDAPQPSSLFQ
jgi:hypothetical protein